MRTIKILFVLILSALSRVAFAQEMPAAIKAALKTDESVGLAKLINKDSLNNCYQEGSWQYPLLSQTIRYHAAKCFNLLIAHGADVNKTCDGYIQHLMHAAKYGSLVASKTVVRES